MKKMVLAVTLTALMVISCATNNTGTVFSTRTAVSSNGVEQAVPKVSNLPGSVTVFVNSGKAKFEKGDYDGAIADFTQAIRLDPTGDTITYYAVRGIAYSLIHDYDRSIADLEAALRINPNHVLAASTKEALVMAYSDRGLTYAKKADYDRALADLTQAIRLDPNNADALYRRGFAYANKDDYDRAIADYTAALKIDPAYIEALHDRGVIYGYKAALKIDEALNDRGAIYAYKEDLNRAIADWEAVLKINPNHAGAKQNLETIRKMQTD